jgi:hypothetical protein
VGDGGARNLAVKEEGGANKGLAKEEANVRGNSPVILLQCLLVCFGSKLEGVK